MEGQRLADMHCHLDFMSNAAEVAADAAQQGLAIFATTVTPQGYERACGDLAGHSNVRIGVGLHPWWVADGRCTWADVEQAAALAREARYVGEVGLDFSPKHVPDGSNESQVKAFAKVVRACADGTAVTGPKLLSIHSVRSAGTVLDVLQESGCLETCRCIFHWFSGTSDELHRAVKAGCWFSINEMMLATRRGREYARQLPLDKLLLETDLPPQQDAPFSAEAIISSLERTVEQLVAIKKADVRSITTQNALELLQTAPTR